MSNRVIDVSEKKVQYESELNSLFDKYSRVLFVAVDNVRSQQIHHIRRDMRGKAVLVMGKKTLQRKIVDNRATRSNASQNDKVFREKSERLSLLRGNVGLIFTNSELGDVKEILEKHRIQAPARVGAISPCEVIIPAGNTGMEPTMTSFFQALSIATKITKGTVEIISDKKVLTTGQKVDQSTASLLQKLKISPFYYQMEIKQLWDRGVVFEASDLAIKEEDMQETILSCISACRAISVAAGIPTPATFGAVAGDAFKNLLAIAVATKYEFSEYNAAETIKNAREGKLAFAAAPAAAAAAPAAAPAAAAKAAAKAPEPEPEEEDDDFGMGGLF